jgi:predicted nicotinamide N-methyase
VKSIKMPGLAAIAALMAMAFVGASSAMATDATALCTEDESPCADANLATHVHEVSTNKAKLLSNSLNAECDVLFLGDVQADGTTKKRLTENAPLIIKGNLPIRIAVPAR